MISGFPSPSTSPAAMSTVSMSVTGLFQMPLFPPTLDGWEELGEKMEDNAPTMVVGAPADDAGGGGAAAIACGCAAGIADWVKVESMRIFCPTDTLPGGFDSSWPTEYL